jgi:hypothetical protein
MPTPSLPRRSLAAQALLGAFLVVAPLVAAAQNVIWVTNTNAFGPGSLMAAIQSLQPASAMQQQIRFGFMTSSPVGASNVIFMNQPLPALDGVDLLIDGSDISAGVIIEGGGHPILRVPTGATTTRLAVRNLTLRRGGTIGRGACLSIEKAAVTSSVANVDFEQCRAFLDAATPARGGALYSAGGIEILDTTFRDNEVLSLAGATQTRDGKGGAVAIEANRAVTIGRSLFENNRVYLTNTLPSFCSGGDGGALMLAISEGAPVVVSESTFIGNGTPCRNPTVTYDVPGQGDGGAIVVYGTASYAFRSNFFSGNIGRRGGGIGVDQAFLSTLEITNNTFHSNRGNASGGGLGIINCCTSTVDHNTFVDNTGSSTYGSQFAIVGSFPASVRFNAMSGDSPVCTQGFINSVGSVAYNAYSDAGCAFSGETNALAGLGTMDFFQAPALTGGDVLTMRPDYGSAVIDAGPDGAPCPAQHDARGLVRPLDGDFDGATNCDIGAVESIALPIGPLFADGFEAGQN